MFIAGRSSARAADEPFAAPPNDAVGSVSLSYAAPHHPGDGFRLQLCDVGSAGAVLLITRAPLDLDSASSALTEDELATATILPVTLDAAGKLDVAGIVPNGLSAEELQAAGFRFRIAFADPSTHDVFVTDPVPVMSGDSEDETATSSSPAAPPAVAPASSVATGAPSLSTGSIAQSVTPGALGSTSTTTSNGTTGAAASPEDPGPQAAQAPPTPTAGKAKLGNSSSYSAPTSGSLPARLISTNSLVAATHDQPSPIQGSGH